MFYLKASLRQSPFSIYKQTIPPMLYLQLIFHTHANGMEVEDGRGKTLIDSWMVDGKDT